MPPQGGCSAFGCQIGRVLGIDPTIELLRKWRHAGHADPEVMLPERDTGDHSRVIRRVYRNDAGQAVVVHEVVVGGGHTTPGGPQLRPVVRNLVGLGWRNRDVSAEEEAMDFFESATSLGKR